MLPRQPRSTPSSSSPAARTSLGFGSLDVNSHEDVLMLLVKLNLCMTALVLGLLLFIAGGKLRRWRSAKAAFRVKTVGDAGVWGGSEVASLDGDGRGRKNSSPQLSRRGGGGPRLWRSWRRKLAASSARMFSSERPAGSRKDRDLELEVSEADAQSVTSYRPASATIFHWSPAATRALAMSAAPAASPQAISNPQHQQQHLQQPQHMQQQQHLQQPQHLQQQQHLQQPYYSANHRLPRQFLPMAAAVSDATTVSSSSPGGSLASFGATSAASAAALLTCRCPQADLRLHNTPASSEFSLVDELLPHRRAQHQLQQPPPPPPPPQTPTSESVTTSSSC